MLCAASFGRHTNAMNQSLIQRALDAHKAKQQRLEWEDREAEIERIKRTHERGEDARRRAALLALECLGVAVKPDIVVHDAVDEVVRVEFVHEGLVFSVSGFDRNLPGDLAGLFLELRAAGYAHRVNDLEHLGELIAAYHLHTAAADPTPAPLSGA